MAEPGSLQGGAPAGPDRWKSHAYAGYSMICKDPGEQKRVVKVLDAKQKARANIMASTVFTGFVFVEPAKSMTVNAFDSWRSRHKLRELDLIVHTSADTVAENLLSCLRPQNDRERVASTFYLCPSRGLRPGA